MKQHNKTWKIMFLHDDDDLWEKKNLQKCVKIRERNRKKENVDENKINAWKKYHYFQCIFAWGWKQIKFAKKKINTQTKKKARQKWDGDDINGWCSDPWEE